MRPFPAIQISVVCCGLMVTAGLALASEATPREKHWKRDSNTPGTALSFDDVTRVQLPDGSHSAAYRPVLSGAQADRTFRLWLRKLDGSTSLFPLELRADDLGHLEGVDGEEITFAFVEMKPGEPVEFLLRSTDRKIKIAGQIVPFPIEVQAEAGCQIAAVLVRPDGSQYLIVAAGFQPREEIEVLSDSGGEILRGRGKANDDGRYFTILAPEVEGMTGAVTTLTLTGKSCSASIDFAWGDALKVF